LLRRAAELEQRGVAFAVATVIRREPASSAQVGNTAIIEEDGAFHGWVGGRRPAASPRFISLSPAPRAETRPGVTALPMTCHSGGSVDIFIEPLVPAGRPPAFGVPRGARGA